MSNTVETPSEPTVNQNATGLTLSQVLQIIKDNFVLVSAGAVVLGAVLSTTFLASYLSVFDWHLLWFIQYPDILTFGLIAVGIISGSLILIQSAAQSLLTIPKAYPKHTRWWTGGVVVVAITIVVLNVWGAIWHGTGYFHVVYGALTLGIGIAVVLVVASYVTASKAPTIVQFTFVLLLFIVGASSFGAWLGQSVNETAKPQDVTVKSETISQAKLIIVMARHTILLKDKTIYVVQTSDIVEFKSAAP